MNAKIAIRRARPDDAPLLHRMICELAAYEREPDAVESTPEILREQLAQVPPPFECLIAELAGEPAGIALYYATYSTWRGRAGIHLEDLFVPESLRGQGIGLALLRALAAIVLERGGARLEWTVLDWNAPAIGFYRGLGARPLEEWTSWRLDGEALQALASRHG